MQQIIISGTLLTDAAKFTDKNGREFTRFTVTCGETDITGKTVYTHYRCTCYLIGYGKMTKGDQVFITGKFLPKLETDDKGKYYMALNVMVSNLTGGYRHSERNKK